MKRIKGLRDIFTAKQTKEMMNFVKNTVFNYQLSNIGTINISAIEANIKAGESIFQSEFGSKTTNASISVGNNGVGISAGYSQSDNFILSNTHNNSEILAKNGIFSLNTTKNTNIKGGNVIANQVALNIGGDLNLETLQDTYEQQGSSYGINIGAGAGKGGDGGTNGGVSSVSISMGATDIFSKTTGRATGIVALSSNDNNLSEEQNLNNLLNGGSITVAGNIDNQTQKEDITFINADFEASLTVPTAIFTKAGRAKMKNDILNLGTNLMIAGYGATNTISNAAESLIGNNQGASIVDNFKAKQTEQVVALNRGANITVRDIINNLGAKKQNSSDIQNALAVGQEPGKGATVYYDENASEAGFYDTSKGKSYINLAKGTTSDVTSSTNTNSLLFVDGHERGHQTSDSEGFANMVGQEANTAWKAVNFIYGDGINTNPTVTSNSWANYNGVGNAGITNVNQMVQSSILNHNNQAAANVNPANRDNLFPLAVPLAYALAETILTNEALKQQGDGDAGVGAHRIIEKTTDAIGVAYEEVKNIDPHLRQSIENVEDAALFVVSKTISGSDMAVSSLFDTNSNQPVTETLSQVNQWYDNLPESQKGSVDLAGILTSVVGSQYLSTIAKSINKPNVDLSGVGNNSPGTGLIVHPFSDGATHITTTKFINEFRTSSAVGNPNGEGIIKSV
jgi:hypothetical protein